MTPVEITDGSQTVGKDINDGAATKATAAGDLKPAASMLGPGSAAEIVDRAFPEPRFEHAHLDISAEIGEFRAERSS